MQRGIRPSRRTARRCDGDATPICRCALVAALLVVTVSACARGESDRPRERPRIAMARLEIPTSLVIPWWSAIETTFLHDQLIEALVATGAFDVVERTRLDTLLDEQKLTKTEVTDPSKAAELGRMLGASHFIVGSLRTAELVQGDRRLPYTQRSERTANGTIRFTFRVVDVESSRIVLASTAEAVASDRAVGGVDAEQVWRDLQRRAGEQLAQQVAEALVPVEIVRVEDDRIALNRGTSTGVAAGQRFEIVPANGKPSTDAGRAPVGTLEVTEVGPDHATARVTSRQAEIRAGMTCRSIAPPPPQPVQARRDPLEDRW